MRLVKKLDLYILRKFLLMFAGAFFVCLFVFMMQFTWRSVNDLIGKGLSIDVFAQFYWYMSLALVAMSLPMAVLLASLITFGNMGESLELLAMKAAGVPLLRIMRPILFFVLLITGVSFYFQNTISPDAQIKMRTLLFSMKQQSPAVEIPEGVFYSGVPNVNLYVKRKNAQSGMLYDLIIYKTDQGFDRAQIVRADSGRMEMTEDKMNLILHLWHGEQFENLQQNAAGTMLRSAGVPYDRETFVYKRLLIDFDANFNIMDQALLENMASVKSMKEIEHDIDSVGHLLDSVGQRYFEDCLTSAYTLRKLKGKPLAEARRRKIDFDSLLASATATQRDAAQRTATSKATMMRAELEWRRMTSADGYSYIRKHWVEWHQKLTLSLACLFFFFIGAPLGAIIRKGGLGMPTVISVAIFIAYHIINTSGMNMAKNGSWGMIYGMWISSAVLLPVGIWISYKANRDSVVFNIEIYARVFRKLLGLREQRHIFRKEVIIEDPDYQTLPERIGTLVADMQTYAPQIRQSVPNYTDLFFHSCSDCAIGPISERLEALVEELSNTKDAKILACLNAIPVLQPDAQQQPFASRKLNLAAGLFLPLGGVLWLRTWRFRLRLSRDLRQTVQQLKQIDAFVAKIRK